VVGLISRDQRQAAAPSNTNHESKHPCRQIPCARLADICGCPLAGRVQCYGIEDAKFRSKTLQYKNILGTYRRYFHAAIKLLHFKQIIFNYIFENYLQQHCRHATIEFS
jgi:hypothetical protein